MTASAIDADLVRRLLRAQFPRWADLPVEPIEPGGWDNRSFRLGSDKLVRLPSGPAYALQVEKEQHWLPILAPPLPVRIPRPLGLGRPGEGYSWSWSVYEWLPGEMAQAAAAEDPVRLACALAGFLRALHVIDGRAGPPPGPHNCHRGGPLAHYDAEVRDCLSRLGRQVEGDRLLALWEGAVSSRWQGPPLWVHGDLVPSNLLVSGGRLSAVIDFGCCGVGDPACDLAIAWSTFDPAGRAAFREKLPLDRDTWLRGRGWALWKALVTLAGGDPRRAAEAERTLAQVLNSEDLAR